MGQEVSHSHFSIEEIGLLHILIDTPYELHKSSKLLLGYMKDAKIFLSSQNTCTVSNTPPLVELKLPQSI
jgi:hypothetical protein